MVWFAVGLAGFWIGCFAVFAVGFPFASLLYFRSCFLFPLLMKNSIYNRYKKEFPDCKSGVTVLVPLTPFVLTFFATVLKKWYFDLFVIICYTVSYHCFYKSMFYNIRKRLDKSKLALYLCSVMIRE